ncbi:MAG: DUF2845 domain-containing protein [Nitrospirae bacterium]|nr:DUF2845 domain-containing protein [Nitrospirota bacterium]
MKTVVSCMILFVLSSFLHSTAFAFRCGDGIVSTGDSKAEVIMKCGEPAAKEARTEELVERIDADRKQRTTVIIDEWTYNPGPSAFIRILTFTNNKLTDIKETVYGSVEPISINASCDEQSPIIGDTKAEVRIKCGEPFWKDSREEEVIGTIEGSKKKKVIIVVDEWIYNFGPNRFVRIYQFKNGKLVDIRTGGYGK